MRLHFSLLALLIVVASAFGSGQDLDLGKDRIPITELSSPWRFHTGDDPNWADPNLDDSLWPRIKPDQSWYTQGYKDYDGVAWYRIRVIVPADESDLAILISWVSNSYSVYANGHQIGQVGELPPKPRAVYAPLAVFRIPSHVVDPGQPLVIALRVWSSPLFARFFGAGLVSVPVLGDAAVVANWRIERIQSRLWQWAEYEFLIAAYFFAAFLALGLFALRRFEREYLWFGVAQIFWLLGVASNIALDLFRIPTVACFFAMKISYTCGFLSNLLFFHALLHERRRTLFWIAALPALVPLPFFCLLLFGRASFAADYAVLTTCAVPYAVAVAILLLRSALRRKFEALLLVIPYTLDGLDTVYGAMRWVIDMTRHPVLAAFDDRLNHLIAWPFNIGIYSIIGLLCVGSVCGVLILRYARSRRDEERLEAELNAARTVQQILIPAEIPAIPGYLVEAVYRPASQVGGDFFQIIPIETGGALIVIGDVSGKGLPAAMTVSLLVGTFRTLVHYTHSPGEILAAMNRRMLARSRDGFTTCLVLRADADGKMTAANAGHLSPYVNGAEWPLRNGLPLGIDGSSSYQESTLHLADDDQLTLMTDGVIEARGRRGELYGFDRVALIASESAESIAHAAQDFGQADDITVVTLHRDVKASVDVSLSTELVMSGT